MKVAIVQEHVDARRGGAETSTVEMAQQLAALGLSVTILYRGTGVVPFTRSGVEYHPVAVGGGTRSLQTYRYVQAVHRICRPGVFDIVQAVTPCLVADVYQPRGGTYAETIARNRALTPPALRGLKWLGRRFNVRQLFLQRIEQRLLRAYTKRVTVAALSDYVRRQVVEGLGFPAARVRVVFNGVDMAPIPAAERDEQRVQRRAALGLAPNAPLVLFVAHNFKLKGLAELLRAQACSVGQDTGHAARWTLVVAGRDNPRRYVRLAHTLGLNERVRFVGTETPVRAWYAAADVLAHPTWYDPCSRVVLEALCVGLPVVTTRYNGAAEIMQPGRQGIVIAEPDDRARLAAALAKCLQPELRVACAVDAPQLCELLSMARHARELLQLYAEIVAARPGAQRSSGR